MVPTIISVVSQKAPPSILSFAVSLVTAIGLIGAAAGPLIVGFIADAGGIRFLAAIIMGLTGIFIPLWFFVASSTPKKGNTKAMEEGDVTTARSSKG